MLLFLLAAQPNNIRSRGSINATPVVMRLVGRITRNGGTDRISLVIILKLKRRRAFPDIDPTNLQVLYYVLQ